MIYLYHYAGGVFPGSVKYCYKNDLQDCVIALLTRLPAVLLCHSLGVSVQRLCFMFGFALRQAVVEL